MAQVEGVKRMGVTRERLPCDGHNATAGAGLGVVKRRWLLDRDSVLRD